MSTNVEHYNIIFFQYDFRGVSIIWSNVFLGVDKTFVNQRISLSIKWIHWVVPLSPETSRNPVSIVAKIPRFISGSFVAQNETKSGGDYYSTGFRGNNPNK